MLKKSRPFFVGERLYLVRGGHIFTVAEVTYSAARLHCNPEENDGMNPPDAWMSLSDLRAMAKRLPGRPEGAVKDGGRKKTHGITLSAESWEKAQATGNASAYIERLVLQDSPRKS